MIHPRSFVLLSLLIASSLSAAEFFVDGGRGDDASGTGSAAKPWKTLQSAASRMAAGDTCTIRAGIYRETVLPRDGQTFQAHPGEQGIISGCDVLTEWELGKDGIARANVPAAVRQVFLADQSLPKARFPDDDGDRYDTSS